MKLKERSEVAALIGHHASAIQYWIEELLSQHADEPGRPRWNVRADEIKDATERLVELVPLLNEENFKEDSEAS